MKLIRVAAAVVNQTPMDWTHNRDNIVAAIGEARSRDVSIVCFPELSIPGYGCEDAFYSPSLWKTSLDVLHEILPHTQGIIVSVGLPILYRNGLFNCAALLVDGHLVGFTAKRYLAGDGLYYEPRWFKPWPEDVAATVEIGKRDVPIGDIYFEVGDLRLGFEICEDAWVAERPGGSMAKHGVDMILNPSASHFAFGKFDVRQRFVLEGSRAFGVTYVYSNMLGNDAGRILYDGGAMIASAGKMIQGGPRFCYAHRHLTAATIDIDATRMIQARTGSFRPESSQDDRCIEVDFEFPQTEYTEFEQRAGSATGHGLRPSDSDAPTHQAWWEGTREMEFEEFTRAIALALFDYLRKSRSHGFVVSLSGGADSSAVATLVAYMVHLAVSELGTVGFRDRLGYIDWDKGDKPWKESKSQEPPSEIKQIVFRLLTCVYQSTRNSSETTRSAARTVAHALGARFREFDVDPMAETYRELVEKSIGRELSWRTDDLTLQNIQARVRAPGVWMLANLENALLLATSNRSEAAVGYATMDGDTCGGLSPIAGIDKDFLRRWLRWVETTAPAQLPAVPEMRVVNEQQPTAELRPQETGQTDETDLMPYEVLDAIEDAAIGGRLSPIEVYRRLGRRYPNYSQRQMADWIERFFRLWCRNQWKRERYAPSFHVDDKNLDPKTWCRFPILSGGFEREIRELRAMVEREAPDDRKQ